MPSQELPEFENLNRYPIEEFQILKNSPSQEYSELLFLCAQVYQATVAFLMVTEGERCWVKATSGPVDQAVQDNECLWKTAVETKEDNLTIPDLKKDERFSNLAALGYSFYSAIALKTEKGERLGYVVVLDKNSKNPTPEQQKCFKILTNQILNLVFITKQNNQYKRIQHNLEQKYHDLEKFASLVSHDIKSPLANIISLTELLKEEKMEDFDEETRQYVDFLTQSSYSLRNYVDGLLTFYRSEKILEKQEEDVDLKEFFENITNLYNVDPDIEISYPEKGHLEQVNKAALAQIFMNLISNALKYNDKKVRKVDIRFTEDRDFYQFEVKDNGSGIPRESFDKIFQLFATLDRNDREGNPGSGIGLATVQKLLHHMGGDITVASEPDHGSTFKFWFRRSG